MTIEELEVLVKQVLDLVNLNTLAIQQMNNTLSKYVTSDSVYTMKISISDNAVNITKLSELVTSLSSSIGVVNKLSKLLDTNLVNVTKNDIIQFDGDRWTNIKPSTLGLTGSGGVTTLEALADVRITNKTDKQSLCWDNATGKWINYTVTSGSGGSGTGELDITAMWAELAKSGSNTIHPSHIKGDLSISALTTNGKVSMTNLNTTFNVLTTEVSINGNLIGTGEITAYGV